MAYISVQTSGILTINTNAVADWQPNGLPIVNFSGEVIPESIVVQQFLAPTGLLINTTTATDFFNEYPYCTNSNLVLYSGCYYTEYKGDDTTDLNSHIFINKTGENTNYDYWYALRYIGMTGVENVYSLIVNYDSKILTKASQPNISDITITASGVPVSASDTRLFFNIDHYKIDNGQIIRTDLVNDTLGNSKYEIYITDTKDNWYDFNGNVIIQSGTIFTNSGTINLSLKFSSDNAAGETLPIDYTIGIRYHDQDNVTTKYLSYKTNEITQFNANFESGKDLQYINPEFKKQDDYTISTDISEKRRLSIDIEDITLISNKYPLQGQYASRIYNLDVPLYSIYLVTKEIIPPGIDPKSIEYYIQFSNEEYRISPINKPTELYDENLRTTSNTGLLQNTTATMVGGRFTTLDSKTNIIPKMLVLDKLNIINETAEIKSILSELPVYSFRVIIKFNIKRNDGKILNEYYIPPSIDFYECHITDRESYLKG